MKQNKSIVSVLLKIMIILIIAGVLCFVGLVLNVYLREISVPSGITADDNFDAIIVLGAQILPDGEPSVQLQWRLDTALSAYAVHPVMTVVCGAKGNNEPYPEAVTMEQYLISHGISSNMILSDPSSLNTRQNLLNAKELLSVQGEIHRVLIVTSDYHVPRALAMASDIGFDAMGLGSPCKSEYWIKNHSREALAWVKYWAEKYLSIKF